MTNLNNQITNEEFIIKSVLMQWGAYCNSCGVKRTAENIKIIKKTADSVILHISCASCKAGHFISYQNNLPGFALQPYSATDLEESELEIFENQPVSTDDLIDAYLALEKVKSSQDLLNIL